MKGDFSRIRFEPNKHYTDVLDQQGRIAYDADHNEQRLIDGHRRKVETIDVIGKYGAPTHDAGFAITVTDDSISIGAGRYYVHGLLCENSAALDYDDQPFLIQGSDTTDISDVLTELQRSQSGCVCVYLEVWQRMVTALDDSCLGEPALGQADTTVRLQTVWRVVATPQDAPAASTGHAKIVNKTPVRGGVHPRAVQARAAQAGQSQAGQTQIKHTQGDVDTGTALGKEFADIDAELRADPYLNMSDIAGIENQASGLKIKNPCSCDAMYKATPTPHTGTLSAQVAENGGGCGCQPIPAAGYTGQENQLYRVEIHQSGTLATATLKWSRENASVVSAVLSASGNKVTVNSLGPDANLGFQENQWVEISDDTDLFGVPANQPGQLYQIQHIDRPSLTLTMTTTVSPIDTTRNARMRRWDQSDSTATATGIPLSSSWIDLENGIQVCFGTGDYVAGDAWTIPARSATGQISWPPCGSDGNPFQSPFYAHIYRAPLACIQFDADTARSQNDPFDVDDCRRIFPTLTDLGGFVNANALHITDINWLNDDAMTFDALLQNGLVATFDNVPTSPLSPATFIVTLETPMVLDTADYATDATLTGESNRVFKEKKANTGVQAGEATTTNTAISEWGGVSFLTPTVVRTPFILDSTLTYQDDTIVWSLPSTNVSFRQRVQLEAINAALIPWATRGTPVRVRVKLVGHGMYASESGKQLYLDGQAFGNSVSSAGEDRQRIDLSFPSGNDQRASDFESWFYLYPALQVESVAFTYSELVVDSNAAIISAVPISTTKPIVQNATITLNYTAVEATTIQLSMTGDADVASVPSQANVAAGDTQVIVPVTINGPPTETKMKFTLTASMPSSLGEATSQTASFIILRRDAKRAAPAPTHVKAQIAAKPSATPAPAPAAAKKAPRTTKRAAAVVKKAASPATKRATAKRKRS